MVGRRLWLRAVLHLQVRCGNTKQPRALSRVLQAHIRPLRWDRTLYKYVCQLLGTYKHLFLCIQTTCGAHVHSLHAYYMLTSFTLCTHVNKVLHVHTYFFFK